MDKIIVLLKVPAVGTPSVDPHVFPPQAFVTQEDGVSNHHQGSFFVVANGGPFVLGWDDIKGVVTHSDQDILKQELTLATTLKFEN